MAGLKEIKRRLQSIRNTRKITYAMKLVSTAKLRKAQESVTRAREYTLALKDVLVDLLSEVSVGDVSHPLLERRAEVKKVRIFVIGGNRGLCGGYNSNLHRRLETLIHEKTSEHPGAVIELVLAGKKPAEYCRRRNKQYLKSYEQLPDDAKRWPVEEFCSDLERAYIEGNVDEVVILFTRFRSAISQTVTTQKLLPMDSEAFLAREGAREAGGVTLFEPSIAEVWKGIVPRILRTMVHQAVLDAKASETGARMTAMDSATKNSGELIQKLQLTYNKLRQGRITAELLDIVGGAEALSK
jgi:F-type H+-transporting ATPase subunit gamma